MAEKKLSTREQIQSLRDQILKLSENLKTELAKQLETARQTYQEILDSDPSQNHKRIFTDPQMVEYVAAFKIQVEEPPATKTKGKSKESGEKAPLGGRTIFHALKTGPLTAEEIAKSDLVQKSYPGTTAAQIEAVISSDRLKSKYPMDPKTKKYSVAK